MKWWAIGLLAMSFLVSAGGFWYTGQRLSRLSEMERQIVRLNEHVDNLMGEAGSQFPTPRVLRFIPLTTLPM